MAAYTPEMGEERPERLFHSEHNFGKSYSLCWKVADDKQARAVLAKLMIRPKVIELRKQGEWLEATRLQSDVYGCLITSASHRKLMSQDQTAERQLLD